MCVANTDGPDDWQPTPHGSLVAMAALGRMPVHFRGIGSAVVDVDDAAAAMLLAVGDVVRRVLRRDSPITPTSVQLLRWTSPLDHGKAERELHWRPRPTVDAIRRAAQFYVERRTRRMDPSRAGTAE